MVEQRAMNQSTGDSAVHLWRGWVPNDAPQPLVMVRGAGIQVFDQNGRAYLDAQAAYSGASCGYGVPAIVDAVAEQARQLPHYPLEHSYNVPALALARSIAGLMPPDLQRVFFCTSGSDAVEAAIKMVRMAQRLRGFSARTIVLTLPDAYHGATLAALTASDIAPARAGFEPFAEAIERMPTPNGAGMLQAIEAYGVERIAAVLLEPVRGVGGVLLPRPGDLAGIEALCRRHDIFLIADEIMTGFGRTGRWFAFEHWDLLPDLITLEKGLTGGYAPLAAVAASAAVYDTFADDPILHGFRHGHTFCGHPIACAAGVATLETIRRGRLVENAAAVGADMLEDAQRLRRHKAIVDVRGLGLLLGIETKSDAVADRIQVAAKERGLLLRPQRKVLTIAPPLCLSVDQSRHIVDILDTSCAAVD
jgi:adenosylmethionine-8-amino-7-oxononanoate aminotransferase